MKTLFDLSDAGGHGEALIVDSFAGGGGASTGIEMALGRSPDIAINHNADALAMHQVNHPETLHLSKNIWQVDPLEAVGHRRVGLAWFSPDCKHFSKAKGGRPVKRSIRDLAWVVVLWARRVRPEVIILENVEEFRDWGPVTEDGRPCRERKGQTFERWTGELRRLGYRMEWRELRACDYGAPTIRKRFFMIARRDGKPIAWPERTHGDPRKAEDAKLIAAGRLLPWRTAAEIIDWSLPCPSIFDSSEEIFAKHGLRAIRPLADATMRRIARGVVRYVLEAKQPFVVPVSRAAPPPAGGWPSDGAGETSPGVRSDARPAGGAPFVSYGQQGGGNRPADAPLHTITASPKDQNAVIVPTLVGCGGRAGQSAPRGGDEPLGTLTAKPDGCVVAPVLVETAHGEVSPSGVKRWGTGIKPTDEPMGTGTISGNHAVVAPYLVPRYQERDGQQPRVRSVEEPAATVVPGGNEGVLAAVHLSRFTQNGVGSAADEPVDTVMAGAPKFGVVAAFLAQHNNDTKPNGVDFPRAGRPADEPVGTLTTQPQQSVVAAFLAQHNTGNDGHDAREPVSTLTTGGSFGVSQQAVVAAHMMRQFGTSVGHDLGEPAHTDTATVNKSALISGFLTKYYGEALPNQALDDPVHTVTVKPRHALVTVEIDGQTYAIADIGMRMLTPRERFRAQGFPDDYVIDRRPDGSPITATVQGSCCGNSVCPPLAEALVRANCGHLARIREAAE